MSFLQISVVAVLLSVLGTCFADGPEQIHISYTGDQSSMFVTWVTSVYYGEGEVLYGPKYSFVEKAAKAVTTKVNHPGKDGMSRDSYTFRATMTHLEMNTTYWYFVTNQGRISPAFYFHTFPNNSDFNPTICVFGDFGVENDVALKAMTADGLARKFDILWHIGDIAYDMYEVMGARGDAFMNMVQPFAATIPYSVIPGNHEAHYNFSEYRNKYTTPGPSVFYHSYNVGPIHIVMINTEFYIFDEWGTEQIQSQYNWLDQDLAAANTKEARAEQPWIIVVGHRPMYCSTETPDCDPNNPIRTGYKGTFNLEDLFYKHGVDLEIYGHMHNYERVFPMYQWKIDYNHSPNLIKDAIYPMSYISGSPGNREKLTPFQPTQPKWSMFRNNVDYGYSYIRVKDRLTLDITQFSVEKMADIDHFVVQKTEDFPAWQRDSL